MSEASHADPDLADDVENRAAGEAVEAEFERVGVDLVADDRFKERRSAADETREA